MHGDSEDITAKAGGASSPLHEFVALAVEKGYAIDFSIYGGEHLDVYEGGARITGHVHDDPMDVIRAGIKALEDRPLNVPRFSLDASSVPSSSSGESES